MNKFFFLLVGPVSRKFGAQIKYSKSARILAYKQFYFVLLTNSFILLSEKLLKHLSGIITTTFPAR